MKFILAMILCSSVTGTCMPPVPMPGFYQDAYDCMVDGYKKSIEKIEEIGREQLNEHGLYIRFGCNPYQELDKGLPSKFDIVS